MRVPYPLTTLRAISNVLKPGGYLFLDTGIGYDWLDRVLPGVSQWYDPPQHLYVFSKRSMELLLRKAGFSVVELDPCFETSALRRSIRVIRNAMVASNLRVVAEVTRLRSRGPFSYTRFPLGNLMPVVAKLEN